MLDSGKWNPETRIKNQESNATQQIQQNHYPGSDIASLSGNVVWDWP
jgi:hypothetical protein